jgi:hypothetical protein
MSYKNKIIQNKWHRNYYHSKDKPKRQTRQKKKYQLNKELIKARQKRYYEKNKKEISIRKKEYRKRPLHRYWILKSTARVRKKELVITLKEFTEIIKQSCVYCGELKELRGIDRIDSAIGYIRNNCVPCCPKCNFMKHELSIQEFKEHIIKIYKHLT